MTYLSDPFAVDVFVSYAHGAFKNHVNTLLKLWSQQFAKDLALEIGKAAEFADLVLFLDSNDRRDEGIDPTGELAAQLEQHARNAALLVTLMSSYYQRSCWCAKELEWWVEGHQSKLVPSDGHAFPCRILPTEQGTWPKPLVGPDGEGLPGFQFFDREMDPDMVSPFCWRGGKERLDDYAREITRLAGYMMRRLRGLRELLDERKRQLALAEKFRAESGQILFLHSREGTGHDWERICHALQDENFVVLPDGPAPIPDQGGLDQEYQIQLAQSDALLLL